MNKTKTNLLGLHNPEEVNFIKLDINAKSNNLTKEPS